jgi:hypothetical protein
MRATNWLTVLGSHAWLLGLGLGCAAQGPLPPKTSDPRAAAAPVEPNRLQDRDWGVVRAAALGLKLALPEARAWLQEPGLAAGGPTWELRHEPTGSSLRVRRWRASRLPRVESCEAELRQRTADLPRADASNVVARRSVRIPEGFVTLITLLAVPGKSARVEGDVLAIGAGVGECIAVVARTECATEAELAERLRLLDISVGHLRLMQIEDRVPAPARATSRE